MTTKTAWSIDNQPQSVDEVLSRYYPFAATPDPSGGYGIVFPDLPGCTSYSPTWEGVGAAAREASAGWLESEFERNYPIPAPSNDWDPSPPHRTGLTRLDGQPEPELRAIYTTEYVAEILDVTPGRIRQIARQRSLGQIVAGVWMFTPADVVAMQDRPGRGRPATGRSRSTESVPASGNR